MRETTRGRTRSFTNSLPPHIRARSAVRFNCGGALSRDLLGAMGILGLALIIPVLARSASIDLRVVAFAGWTAAGLALFILWRARSGTHARTVELLESVQARRDQFFMSPAIMLLISPKEGRIVDANQAALAFYGYPAEKLLAMRIADINLLPEEEVLRAMASVGENQSRHFDFKHRLADGSIRDVEVSTRLTRIAGRPMLNSTIHDVSARRLSEVSLNKALTRYHTLLETVSDGIHVLNEEGELVEASSSFYRMLGYEPGDPGLRHISDWESRWAPGEYRPLMADWLERSECFETRHRCRDGQSIDVEINLRGITIEGKNFLYASSRDISERRRMLENLSKLSKTVDQSPVSIVITNVAGDIEYVNPKFTEITGYTPEEAIGQNPRVLKSGDKAPEEYRQLWENITAGHEWRGEFCNRKKSGEVYWERALISPIRDSANTITHFLAIKEDITASRRTEMALRESEARLRSITDAARDAILMLTPDGQISFWNPAAERILGYTRAEALGQDLQSLLSPRHYRADQEFALAAFLQEGQGAPSGKALELEVRRNDGEAIPVQLSLSGIQMEGRWHAVGLLRDITEQKRAEEALVLTNQNLEAATARASEMAIRAESASAAKSEFLANMSHEIRTPMNGVIGMIGLLMDTELDAEQRRYAEIVRASGESLLSLLNDILDFSKIEAGRLDLEMLDFDLLSLLDDFAATLASRAREKKLELYCTADPEVPVLLRGDPGRLRQVLHNLAGNALKFTEAGDVVIRVSNVEERDDGVTLRFSVRDTGIGIPEEKKGILFDKFSQVDASTTRVYGGTGLGLAISKQLAELMGGEIGVESTPGVGSTFWFTARLGKQSPEAAQTAPPPPELRGVRALIVDDNETSREILATRLLSWGMRPEAERSGDLAVEALQRAAHNQDPYRIAVIDMQMPGMDGAALGRTIREDAHLSDTRMVLLTSLGARGDARRFQEIGFAGYATKPIQHQELRDVLSLVLSGEPGAASRPITTRHSARETALRFQGRKARILLAEDNITNQRVALGILKRLGLSADAVANGAEAVRALETLPYDIVLMDVQMPEMDGIEATRQIRTPESAVPNHQIPIIAMTAHALQGDRDNCLKAGMNDYVSKPVSPQALAAALEKWLPPEIAARPVGRLETRATSAASRVDVQVFDRKGMMSRLMDDEEIARNVVKCFLEDMPRQLQALRDSLEAGEVDGIRRQAHTIKGASSNIGGMALCAAATAAEDVNNLETARNCVAEIDREFQRLKAVLSLDFDGPKEPE
ncbi:MAG: PAS domain S-box protein [Candidatus Hydrogenedentes bacterium]|nr:PAS domain S-box protein [Candidatus Hydrogenedentota bacterium]